MSDVMISVIMNSNLRIDAYSVEASDEVSRFQFLLLFWSMFSKVAMTVGYISIKCFRPLTLLIHLVRLIILLGGTHHE